MKKTYIILSAIAAVVLLVYLLLPKVTFEEMVFPLENGASLLAYDDQGDGGMSRIEFGKEAEAVSFRCTLGEDTTLAAWCGLLWNFDPDSAKLYRNWSLVDSLVLIWRFWARRKCWSSSGPTIPTLPISRKPRLSDS
jgi:hypothetical protein